MAYTKSNIELQGMSLEDSTPAYPFDITATSTPVVGGSATGGGAFLTGEIATLIATATATYLFINWTENGIVVSLNATYSFTVNSDRELVANFFLPTFSKSNIELQGITLECETSVFESTFTDANIELQAISYEYNSFKYFENEGTSVELQKFEFTEHSDFVIKLLPEQSNEIYTELVSIISDKETYTYQEIIDLTTANANVAITLGDNDELVSVTVTLQSENIIIKFKDLHNPGGE